MSTVCQPANTQEAGSLVICKCKQARRALATPAPARMVDVCEHASQHAQVWYGRCWLILAVVEGAARGIEGAGWWLFGYGMDGLLVDSVYLIQYLLQYCSLLLVRVGPTERSSAILKTGSILPTLHPSNHTTIHPAPTRSFPPPSAPHGNHSLNYPTASACFTACLVAYLTATRSSTRRVT